MAKEDDLLKYYRILAELSMLYDDGFFERLKSYDLSNLDYKKIDTLDYVTRIQRLNDYIQNEGQE